ncbi:MAG: hypothetical protein ACLVBX_06550 [Faecalibacterium prausnitzii]
MEYYNELVAAAGIDWMDDLTYRPKVNMSDSVTALKNRQRRLWMASCPMLLQSTAMESSAEVMVEYRKNLDLPTAIKVVDNRHKALEEQRRLEEERRVRQAEREAAAEKFAPLLPQQSRRSPNWRRKFQ